VAANAQANMTLKITEQTAIVFTFPISVFLGVFIADSVFYAKFRFDPVSSGDILITIQLVKPYLAWFALIFLMLLTKKPAPVFLGGMTAATVSVAYKFYLA
jgi:hypothetical protein